MALADGGREEGAKSFPYHGLAGAPLAGASPVAGVGSPESSEPGAKRETPAPSGVMLVRCQECGGAMPSVQVGHGDPAAGKTSHGICDTCGPIVVRRFRQEMGIPVDCGGCGSSLALDGVCPVCHVGHDGPRCADCGRYAMHRDDCRSMQPPAVADLFCADEECRRFASDDATAYLRGLGLEPLPGAVGL